jgi:voltage-gated potassium channel Kch
MDDLLGHLDIVGYYRSGRRVFIIFRHGSYSVAVTVDLSTVRHADGEEWFEARSEFQVRPVAPLNATWSPSQSIIGYGKTEEEAILAAVNLFTDRFDTGFRTGRVPP